LEFRLQAVRAKRNDVPPEGGTPNSQAGSGKHDVKPRGFAKSRFALSVWAVAGLSCGHYGLAAQFNLA
jgi:hypothetical protein